MTTVIGPYPSLLTCMPAAAIQRLAYVWGSQAFEFEPKRQVSYANTETNPTMQGALFKPPASSRSNSLLLLPIEGRPPSLVESSVRLRAVTLIQLVNQIPG